MNLQFLTNNNPPPAQSVLQYSVNPDTVYVSTQTQPMYADLTITVFNPSMTETITCQVFRFGFLVSAEYGDLTESIDGIQTSSDQSNWTISQQATPSPDNPNLYQFSAPLSGMMANLPLKPNQSLVFHLNDILINEAVGEGGVEIAITEVTGAESNPSVVQGALTISKVEPTLAIEKFETKPSIPISPGDQVNFKWQLTGSDHWQLYDYDTTTLLYDSETSTPPNALSYGPVYPQQNTNYELIARVGQIFTTAYAEAMVMAAHFITEPTATPSVIDPGGQSVLAWETKYASQLTISAADFQTVVLNAPAGQYDYFPDAPNNQWTVSPTTNTVYTLDITGPGNSSDTRPVPVSVNLPLPLINSFTATPVVFTSGQNVTLAWQTSKDYSATLSQKILATGQTTSLGPVPIIESSYPVTPPGGIVAYILSLLGQGVVTGQVIVAENAGTFSPGFQPIAMTFDGANLWVSDSNQSLYKVRPSDGAALGQYTVGSGPFALVFDGENIWTANNVSNNVTKVRVSDGAVVGQYPTQAKPYGIAFDGENIWVTSENNFSVLKLRASDGEPLGNYGVGKFPIGIAFDGENIWVANGGEDTVTKLLASDGSLLGTYAAGSGPRDVLFDGTNIWVSNRYDKAVTKLRPSDGTVLGTSPVGNEPYKLLSYAGNIWVANALDGTLSSLDANTGALQATIPVGETPECLAFDGTYLWVGNTGDGTLMKL